MKRLMGSAARQLGNPAMLVALLALALSLGGTAYAAKLITSKDIKNGTIQVKDLSPKAIKKLAGKQGPAGPAGATGATGAAGADFAGTIPSKRTITGSVYYIITSGSGGQELNQAIAFPAKAPAALVDASFSVDAFGESADDDATCTGTYDVPTAPPGKVCGYLSPTPTTNVTSAELTRLVPGFDKGFVVRLVATAAGETKIDLSWAYTAP